MEFTSCDPDFDRIHRFHSYCARFPSSIVELAIKTYTKSGDALFDPFCGSGTSLVAGLLHDRKVTGSDIDILAGMLSTVKCGPKAADHYSKWRKYFEQELRDRFSEIAEAWASTAPPQPGSCWKGNAREVRLPQFPQLMYWFPPQLSVALATIAQAAHDTGDSHFEQVALLSQSLSPPPFKEKYSYRGITGAPTLTFWAKNRKGRLSRRVFGQNQTVRSSRWILRKLHDS